MMRQCHHLVLTARCWLLVLFVAAAGATDGHASSLIYKNYIVRYDRGWDILCEPYVVQKNDWVLKIFRQKGEIAHRDFRDFTGIFERLNPHIKNIDLIRPGQRIDIPLRKLEQGSLSGQDSGVVTIPFVTLAKVTEVISTHSKSYLVQRGDTVSRLLAREYGRYGSKSYQEGVKLFKAANPGIKDLDRIYAGQKVVIPDPGIREQPWYSAMYDEQGNLKETMGRTRPSETEPAAVPLPMPAPASAPPRSAPPKSPITEAAAAVGAKLYNKGTYFLPSSGGDDFELDLSRHPLMELEKNQKMVFSSGDRIMALETRAFEERWPGIKPVTVDDQASVEQIIGAIFDSLEETETGEAAEVAFEDNGVRIAVRARWIRPEAEGRRLCITPITGPGQSTPDPIRRYLERNGVVLKEILPGGGSAPLKAGDGQRHAVKNILALAPVNQKDFVKTIAHTLGLTYSPDIAISFPYAGIQVQAYADLVAAPGGADVFVDFGALYGDALTAIKATGLTVLQITTEESYADIVRKLLAALGLVYEQNPTILAAQRPPDYNTQITVAGIAYMKSGDERLLLSGAALPAAVSDLFYARGYNLVVW
jgi:LysM repeat protein